MAVRHIKGSWWIDFSFNYTRYRERSPENSKAGAQAYEAVLRHRLTRGEPIEAKKSDEQTFALFADTWFKGYVLTNNKPSEQRQKQLALQTSLIPYFGKMRLSDIGKKDIELYKAYEQEKGNGNKTVNNKLTILRKCLGTAYEWGAMHSAPPTIKRLKYPPAKTDFLTNNEAERLLAHAEGIEYLMILLALRTGMRQSEIRGLQWEAFDWESRILTVRHSFCDYSKTLTTPKNNRERHIPLASDLYKALHPRRWQNGYVFPDARGGPFPQGAHLRLLRGVQKRAGPRKIGWHTLRHTFASHLAEKVSLRTVQELLGHSSITMTMRYAHIGASSLRTAIDLLVPEVQSSNIRQLAVNQEHASSKNGADAYRF